MSELDPSQRTIGVEAGAVLATAATLVFPGAALATQNNADVEKQALAAFNDAPTRSIDSFPAPKASLATRQLIETTAPATASFSNETLIPGPTGLISAESSSLGRFCASKGLGSVEIDTPEMNSPGDEKLQTIKLEADFEPLPEECLPDFEYDGSVKFQVQSSTNPSKWTSSSVRNLPISNSAEEEGGKGIAFVNGFPPYRVKSPNFLYKCTKGAAKTKAQVIVIVKMVNTQLNKVTGQIRKQLPVKINRNPFISEEEKRRGAVTGPC